MLDHPRHLCSLILLSWCSIWLVATATQAVTVPGDPLTGDGDVSRGELTASALLQGDRLGAPRPEETFAIPRNAAPPRHTFEGRLELIGEATDGSYQNVQGEASNAQRRLPEFAQEFVQVGSHLVPKNRGLIITDDAAWQLIVEPGRVWDENADQGFSRASFPFALVEINQMCTHNGVMMFLFDDSTISHVWYQITLETCAYRQGNFWGMLEASYQRQAVANADALREAYAREVADRFPTAPLSRLKNRFPAIDLSQFGRGVTTQYMSSYGVVFGGVHYLAPCRGRYGAYAYCQSLRTPSYSTAKSAFLAVALMRLAQKYGDYVLELKIADFVTEAGGSPGNWSDVTFLNALDMATGHFYSSAAFDDENNRLGAFIAARPYGDKIREAFDAPRNATPGTRWVYRSPDHFILARAMSQFLRSQEGPQADLFQLVVDEIYRPLKMGPGFFSTLRTSDNRWRGEPFGFMGLFWTPDDIAKLSTFLNLDQGAIGGRQLLHPGMLRAALQHNPSRRGLDTQTYWGNYLHGFFAPNYPAQDLPISGDTFWAPFMSGWGGIKIVLLPNGATYHYTSDNHEYVWRAAATEAMRLVPASSGDCSLPAGHPDFCRDCGPCANGQGDCDRDQDCAAGLACVDNVGADFGFGPGIDVCMGNAPPPPPPPAGCTLAPGHPDFCRDCGPCADGQGDCDQDNDCAAGLACVDNVGADFGFGPGIDVCMGGAPPPPTGCALQPGHPDFCRDCGPCASGQGDCDQDQDCAAGLACVDNVGADFGFGPGIDVCMDDAPPCPLAPGHPDYCRDCGPCGHGLGDCDRDSDCVDGASCVDDVGASFGFGPGIDVCVR